MPPMPCPRGCITALRKGHSHRNMKTKIYFSVLYPLFGVVYYFLISHGPEGPYSLIQKANIPSRAFKNLCLEVILK